MSAYGCVNRSILLDVTNHERHVDALHAVFLQLPDQAGLGFRGFCNHQHTAGFLVQTVNNPRARHSAQARSVMQQCVQHGPSPVPAARMHDESGRFVDNNEGFILVNDVKGNCFWQVSGFGGKRNRINVNLLASPDSMFRGCFPVFERYLLAQDPCLQSAPGVVRKQFCQGLVEPQAGAIIGNGQFEGVPGCFSHWKLWRYNGNLPRLSSLKTHMTFGGRLFVLLVLPVMLSACGLLGGLLPKKPEDTKNWSASK